jgi:hypothetical protein
LAWDFLRARPNQPRCSTAKPTKREAVTAFKAKREKAPCGASILNMPDMVIIADFYIH